MGNAACIHSKICNIRKKSPFHSFLSTSWAGSVLNWTESDVLKFAKCLSPVKIKANAEVSVDESSLFIVVEGGVEIHAIVQDISKKSSNLREFLCKKSAGDVMHMRSVRQMVSESNQKFLKEKEESQGEDCKDQKHILNLVDTLSIKSISETTILQLDWERFEENFGENNVTTNRNLDVEMLRTINEG